MIKRFLAAFLSLVMVFSFTVSAYAENGLIDDNIVIENAVESDGEDSQSIAEPNGDGDSFDACEFDDAYDVGDDATIDGTVVDNGGVTTCADCGSDPCTCEKENTESACETCGQEPCVCEPASPPQLCEVCNADPCVCEPDASVVPCETCGNVPCTCVPETSTPATGCEEYGLTEGHTETCSQYEAPAPSGCKECGQAEGHTAECSQFVGPLPQSNIYDTLMAAESVEDMYLALLGFMESDPDGLFALSSEELQELYDYAAESNELEPSEDYADLCDTLQYIAGEYELVGHPVTLAPITSNGAWSGGTTITGAVTYTFENGAIVTLKEPITIANGATLTIEGWGGFARYSTNTNALFVVQEGGKLVIDGTSEAKPVYIDGNDIIAVASLIISSGELDFVNAVIQNGKNRSVYPETHKNAGKPNGQGGGITVSATGSLKMNYCVVTKNTASLNGGGIYSTGPVTISNSEISWNRAMSAETGVGEVNAGRGGGFALTGESADGIFENVLITQNAAMYYGGGGQISGSGSSLVMKGDTLFSYNEAVLHGAGALHITGDASFTMDGGSMEHNTAQYCGGAIHSSYSCVLNLNNGTIKNNTTYGRGGGVHINTGGAITLNEGITISGNKAFNKPTGSYAELDATGDNWSNIKYEGNHVDFGYGGGVLIDSGTCTVAGATITDNYAEIGGGGIALTMLNMGEGGLDDYMVISFTMTGGTVSDNTTDGDGASVYIMTNKAKENLMKEFGEEDSDEYKNALAAIDEKNKHGFKADDILNGIPMATVSGGTISGNVADMNGGGLYLGEKTKFTISGGTMTSNEAQNGGAVYVAQGEAFINGGNITSNEALENGGALYVNGNVTMTDGKIGDNEKGNTAKRNGGAVYITGGNMNIKHGFLNYNSATDGGAIYMDGDADTTFYFQSGKMNNNYASDDGGAIYATGGTLYIGLEHCPGQTRNANNEVITENNETHKKLDATGVCQYHPQIQGNEAEDVGGGIALAGKDASSGDLTVEPDGTLSGGKVHFYCGVANTNKALYKGVGLNVFMQGGEFNYYQGTNIGEPHDPDLVIIGGDLKNWDDSREYVYLYYYQNNTDDKDEPDFKGMATLDSYMNLPEGEYFWVAPTDEVFVGWTPFGPDATDGPDSVRDKDDYKESGGAVKINDTEAMRGQQNTYDGTEDKIMHLYAVWAPEVNQITYVDSLTEAKSTTTPKTGTTEYTLHKGATQTITIPATNSNAHPGFAVVGWYLYQDEGQNANWCDELYTAFEPAYTGATLSYSKLIYDKVFGDGGMVYLELSEPDSDLILTIDPMTFGNITLVAKYELQYSDLTITKAFPAGADYSIDENQAFLFNVIGFAAAKGDQTIKNADALEMISALEDLDIQVVIEGDGSIVIKHLPLGTYTVTEDSDWSWRYGETSSVPSDGKVTLELNSPKTVAFTNIRTKGNWLSGDWYTENWLDNTSIRRKDDYIDPTKAKSH